nr:phosphoribosylanthranilate isomerase [uncultured Mediterraneibacter sp.]
MTEIKICGLSRREDIDYVNEALPDYCGFVIEVPESRRSITKERLCELREQLSNKIRPVGVFVNADIKLISGLLNTGAIEIAQLHGQEDETYIRRLRKMTDKPLIKAFSIRSLSDLEEAEKSSADLVLLDHGKGGTGSSFDWELLREWKGRSYFLAGGLTAENIPEAVYKYHPRAVDLSSSVESDGKKDKRKILAAVAAVRSI